MNKDKQYFYDTLKTAFHEPLVIETRTGLMLSIKEPRRLQSTFNADLNYPLLHIMSGTSESGKSTFGNRLQHNKIATRYKILTAVAYLQKKDYLPSQTGGSGNDPMNLLDYIEKNYTKTQEERLLIVRRVQEHLEEIDTPIAVIETVKHPWLIKDFTLYPKLRAISYFITADINKRTSRESLKRGTSYQDTLQDIKDKDATKNRFGNSQIEYLADITIRNNGSIEEYKNLIDAIGQLSLETTRPFAGIPIQYSL